MKKIELLIVVLFLLCACNRTVVTLDTDAFRFQVDKDGYVSSMYDHVNHREYIAKDQVSPLLAIRAEGEYETPSSAAWDEENALLSLTYPKHKTSVKIHIEAVDMYVKLEVREVRSEKDIDLVIWGPYATSISQTIGECVGVVRDSAYAIGLQALNPKTIGGYPTTEDDVDPSYDIFATTSLADVADSVKVLYRGQAAKRTDFGSVVQAYCRNRDKERLIPMWGHSHFSVSAYNDGGVEGSKIVLFGCPEGKVLDYIEKIELAENLPHPELNGVWMKRAPEATQAYIIYPFNEKNIEEAIELTKRTGLKYLYHGGPFSTWGNFMLNPKDFPNGLDGLKSCVEKAGLAGIKLGIHTLSNFTTTNDSYVTPIPDKRLAKVGSAILTTGVTANQTEIEISDPMFFNQMENNHLHGVMLGEELIRYERVSDEVPWKLLNCQRGAWGTKASVHAKGDTISKLLDHGYKVFLTDIELTKEIARNIAEIFNYSGIDQVSFDGLEGAWSTGLGQYGLSLMIKEWYDHLLPERRNNINDASMTTHYNWHTFTRMNWGEPWYAGFRESQLNYRLMNQDFYRRNLIPCMLGWFKFDANTSIEDMEWLLARSAAFDAGYTLVTNNRAVQSNGNADRLLRAIREWENARLSGAFPVALKKEMEHVANEYSLSETSASSWELFPFHVQRFKHANITRQPGEPIVSRWEFDNRYERQPIQFILRSNDRISDIVLEIANYSTISLDCILEEGQYLKYSGDDFAIIYDKNWNEIKRFPVASSKMNMPRGKAPLIFTCSFAHSDDTGKWVSAELKTKGEKIHLIATRKRN
ncbi:MULTISPECIES: hypothetical protein [Butyricimonas]|uniref:hypothetical protein n=1 Tax=Butyricimonas TaxID=574697 RepID=UPI0007FB299F|nr:MULTISPECIES: hypothetical protein [Butyricimonas]